MNDAGGISRCKGFVDTRSGRSHPPVSDLEIGRELLSSVLASKSAMTVGGMQDATVQRSLDDLECLSFVRIGS